MSYYNTDKNNQNKQGYYNGNPNSRYENPDVRNYEMVIPSSEEYRIYTWNEYARGNVRNIMSEEEFKEKYSSERSTQVPSSTNAQKPHKENKERVRNNRNRQFAEQDAYGTEIAIDSGKKNKFIFLAYIFVLAIIILVVVISTNSKGNAFASGGENNGNDNGASDTTGDHFSNSYYSGKTEIRFSEAEAGDYLLVKKNAERGEKTNWFDAICDKIESIVGG